MKYPRNETLQLSKKYAANGDPNGWFEEFYAGANGDFKNVYWADLKPNPFLVDWINENPKPENAKAIVIACGLGDDAEALASHGYQVTAFEISQSAIELCLKRFPETRVDYRLADLLKLPEDWKRGFDLIYECNTIQILVGAERRQALEAIAELASPGGEVLVSCRSRESNQGLDVWPLALDKNEIDGFKHTGLNEIHFLAYDDDQNPSVPHFFAVYQRHTNTKSPTANSAQHLTECITRAGIEYLDQSFKISIVYTKWINKLLSDTCGFLYDYSKARGFNITVLRTLPFYKGTSFLQRLSVLCTTQHSYSSTVQLAK